MKRLYNPLLETQDQLNTVDVTTGIRRYSVENVGIAETWRLVAYWSGTQGVTLCQYPTFAEVIHAKKQLFAFMHNDELNRFVWPPPSLPPPPADASTDPFS